MQTKTLSIIIPAFNESGNIKEIYRRLISALEHSKEKIEIIFVDDGSTDSTANIITQLNETDPRVGLIQLSRNFGHQAALMAGLDHAHGNAVIVMDADLQHPPEILPEMLAKWRSGALVVQTKREETNSAGWFKRVTSRFFYNLFRCLTDVPIEPGMADFFLLDRKCVDALNRCREIPRFTRGLVTWLGYSREFVHYTCGERYSGKTKYSLRKMVYFAIEAIFAFSVIPLRLAGAIGLVAAILSAMYLLYAVCVRIFGQGAEPGWASLVSTVVFMGGVQLVTLWCIGEYIAQIAERSKLRPNYLINEIIMPSFVDKTSIWEGLSRANNEK